MVHLDLILIFQEMDSDTDEDGDLFGCRPDPLASSSSTVPSSTGIILVLCKQRALSIIFVILQ